MFEAADDVLKQDVKRISELINTSGFINLDFADIKTIMKDAGFANMSDATAQGKDKATNAANMAISSRLLETSVSGAKGLIISITAPPTIEFGEIDAATSNISSSVDSEANIIFWVVFDEKLQDEIKINGITTGFDTSFRKSVRKIRTSDVIDRTVASFSEKYPISEDSDYSFRRSPVSYREFSDMPTSSAVSKQVDSDTDSMDDDFSDPNSQIQINYYFLSLIKIN